MNIEYLKSATMPRDLPRVFPDRPRVAAKIKDRPADFVVEEVTDFQPCGWGSHLYLWIEKRDCAGGDLIHKLAAVLGISPSEIGYAGTKDRKAVTRQWLSVPAICEPTVECGIHVPGVKILGHVLHDRKLKLGRLAGNRFTILLRGAPPESVELVRATGSMLVSTGFPNFFGIQRFGRYKTTLAGGIELMQDPGSRKARRLGRFERRMMISALQSALFNLYLKERMKRFGLSRVVQGDVMKKTATGGLFVTMEPGVEQARMDRGEIVPTGPMYGHKMMNAQAVAGDLEDEILRLAGIDPASFYGLHRLARGTRRPVLVRPWDFTAEAEPSGIRVSFGLPRGSYASVMLRELVEEQAAGGRACAPPAPGAAGPAGRKGFSTKDNV